MDFIKEWITNIIIFILLATVIDMLLPNSSFQKYTKMVTGLLLIAIILTPVLKIVANDFEETITSIPILNEPGEKNIENSIEIQKKEIQAWQHAYILEDMAVQLKRRVAEELMEEYSLEIMNIDFLVDENSERAFPDNLKKVFVQLHENEEETEAVEVVRKVEINTQEAIPMNSQNQDAITTNVVSFLAHKWNVKEDTIEIVLEGGNKDQNGQ